MKRNIRLLAGIAALGVAVGLGSEIKAQQPGQGGIVQTGAVAQAPAQQLRTRIALVNLPTILKNYEKMTNFQREMEDTVKNYDKLFEGKRQLLLQFQNDAQKNAADANQREQYEKKMRDLQREMQDVQDEAKKVLGKKQGDQLVIIYREIEEAVTVYARAKDIELVMHFADVISPTDLYNPNNVQRKLQLGACFPSYAAPGMDITTDVLTMLNTRYRQMQQSAPTPAPGAPPAAPGQR